MGSRSRDPFNFDDIYKQAGVEDLFVKKSMSEMKKTIAPVQPAVRLDAVKAISNGSIPAISSQHSSPRIVHSSESRPIVPSSSPGLASDPFASLGLGQFSSNNSSSQSKMSVPPPRVNSPRQPKADIDIGFLGPGHSNKPKVQPQITIEFDDIFGTSAPKPAAKPSAPVDPFALFEAIPGASAPVRTPPPDLTDSVNAASAAFFPPSHPVNQTSIRQENNADASTSFQQVETNRSSSRMHQSSSSKSLHSASSSSTPRASGTNFSASSLGATPPPPSYEQAAVSRTASFAEQQSLTPSSFNQATADESLQGYSAQSGRGSTSIGGVLMKLGKKVTKVAKDGLATLNDALERLDHAERYGAPRAYRATSKEEEEVDFPAEKALTYAIEISEMPPRQQEEVMGRLPHHIRVKVAQILREQALAEADSPATAEPLRQGTQTPPEVPIKQPPASPEPEIVHTREFRLDEDTPAASYSPRHTRSPPPASPLPTPVAHIVDEDLLGISAPIPATAGAPSPPPPAAVVQDDLLGFDAAVAAKPAPPTVAVHDIDSVTDFFAGVATPAAAPVTVRHTATPSSDSLDAFFSGGEKPAAPKPAQVPAARQAVPARPIARSQRQPIQPMFQDRVGGVLEHHTPVPASTGPVLADHDDDPDEPEIRKQLRAQRIAERDRKMQAALEEKMAKEQAEADHQELQVQLKERYKEDIIVWKNKNKDNVRGLLGSLQTVLWENSGWKQMGMGDLLEPGQVRKAWMKANLIVHPDKVRQRNGTPDQIAIADMVFDVLKEAWGKFQK